MSAQVQPVGQAPEVRGEASSTERAPASTRAALAPALVVAVGVTLVVVDSTAVAAVVGVSDMAVGVAVVIMLVAPGMVAAAVIVLVAVVGVVVVVVVVVGVVVVVVTGGVAAGPIGVAEADGVTAAVALTGAAGVGVALSGLAARAAPPTTAA